MRWIPFLCAPVLLAGSVVWTAACDDGAEPPEGALTVVELLGAPVYDAEVTLHGEVHDLGELLCPCFTLRSDGGSLAVWYDLMVDETGEQRPAVDVSKIENGDQVVVAGELQRPGTAAALHNFWSASIEKLD